jgi:hypothetical protein
VEERQLRPVFAEGHVGFGFVAGGSVRVGRDGLCSVEVVSRRQSCGWMCRNRDGIVVWRSYLVTRGSWLGIHQFSSWRFRVPQDHPCGFPLWPSIVSGRAVQRTLCPTDSGVRDSGAPVVWCRGASAVSESRRADV